MSSTKSAFQEFVETNQALLNCYNAISPADYAKMNDSQKEGACFNHREKLREQLRSNSLVMSNLLRERIAILNRLGAAENQKRSQQ